MPSPAVGGSDQGPFIQLDVPIDVGSTTLGRHADGSVIGGGSPVAGNTALVTPLKGAPLTLDSIESMVDAEAVKDLSTTMSIKMQWQGASSVMALQVQLNSLDPSQPTPPIIPLYYDLSTGQLSVSKPDGTQAPVVLPAGGSTTAVGGTSGNPWLAGNVMVTFLITFMEMVNTLMRMKMVEGNLQIQGMNLTVELANNAAQLIMQAAQAQSAQHMAAAICAGISAGTTLACTIGSVSFKFKSMATESQMVQEDVVPDKITPSKLASTSPQAKSVSFSDDTTQDDKFTAQSDGTVRPSGRIGGPAEGSVQEGVPGATGAAVTGTTQGTGSQGTKAAIQEEEEGGGEDISEELAQSASAQQSLASVEEEESTGANNAQEELDDMTRGGKTPQVQQQEVQKAQAVKVEEEEQTTSKVGKQEKVKMEEDSATEDNRKLREDIQKKNKGIREANQKLKEQAGRYSAVSEAFHGLQGVLQQSNQAASESLAATLTLATGRANAQKEVIDAIKSVTQTAYMHNMGEAFKSNTDLISQVLSTWDAIHQRLADAIAAALRH